MESSSSDLGPPQKKLKSGAKHDAAPAETPKPAEPTTKSKRARQYKFSVMIKEEHKQPIYSVVFCEILKEFENTFATVGGNRASVYDCKPDGSIDLIQAYIDEDDSEQLYTCAWSIDAFSGAPLLAVGGLRGIVKIINCTKKVVTRTIIGHGNSINDIHFHPVDLSLLLTASKDESVRLWNVTTGVCIAVFAGHKGHRDEVLSADINILGSFVASSGMDNSIKIWSLEDPVVQQAIKDSYTPPQELSGQPFKTKFIQFPLWSTSKVHNDYVDNIRWVGNMILSKSIENKLVLWKFDTGRRRDAVTILREMHFSDAEVWFIRFSVDSRKELVAVGNLKGKVFVWDIDGNPAHAAKLSHPQCKSTVRQTAFSPKSNIVLCCCDDSSVWRYDEIV